MKICEMEVEKRFRLKNIKEIKGKLLRIGEGSVVVYYDHLPYTALTISRETEVEEDV